VPQPKMPRTVKVAAHTYTILRKSKTQLPNDVGMCDFDALQIWVRERLKKSVARETLLHELCHACTYPSFIDATVTDERFIEALSPVLLQVLQDNPELLEYLTK
jgi:hypothetical protein